MSALIIICGTPCSGKTTISSTLRGLLEEQNPSQSIVQVTDFDTAITSSSPITTAAVTGIQQQPQQGKEQAVPTRNVLYSEFSSEKKTRAQLRTNVERALSTPNTIVIVDSLNYIKGFRYELFCIAKTMSVSYAVIYTIASKEICFERDAQRQNENDRWGKQLLTSLTNRFEVPQSKNRWDNPLFVIDTEEESTNMGDIFTDIIDSIRNKGRKNKNGKKGMKKLNASLATKQNALPTVNDLSNIDRITRNAESFIIPILQNEGTSVGQSIQLPNSNSKLYLQRLPKVHELRDMRRTFLNYSRMNPPISSSSNDNANPDSLLLDEYISYINEQLKMIRRY